MLIHPQVLTGIMRSARRDRSNNALPHALEVTVRRATDGDAAALVRLAALDSANVLPGPVLVAEVDGTPMAAISLADGRVVADPFERTADLVELLRVRAAQSRAAARRDGRRIALARGEAGTAQSIANQT
jgi:hypothetical protein